MIEDCGCCEGVEKLTPMPIRNRPGLATLSYRVGTHATFLTTMEARLSGLAIMFETERGEKEALYPARQLTTRTPDDPAIALLDAWASVADVLTFYQERIANEGYLGTAKERRSIIELARLVGYSLRPGVASSVYLSFTLETGYELEVPVGTRAQSLPGPGELPQSFETGRPLAARDGWNRIQPRMTRPQQIQSQNGDPSSILYVAGTSTNLKPNDPLLLVAWDQKTTTRNGGNGPEGEQASYFFRRVESVEPDAAGNRTKITLQAAPGEKVVLTAPAPSPPLTPPPSPISNLSVLLPALLKPPSLPPASSLRLARPVETVFGGHADMLPQLVTVLKPSVKPALYKALRNVSVTKPTTFDVFALRTTAAVFGHNAPAPVDPTTGGLTGTEWMPSDAGDEAPNRLFLDNAYDAILPGSYVAIQKPESPPQNDHGPLPTPRLSEPPLGESQSPPVVAKASAADLEPPVEVNEAPPERTESHAEKAQDLVGGAPGANQPPPDRGQPDSGQTRSPSGGPLIFTVREAITRPRKAYGISAKTTVLTLSGDWWNPIDRTERGPGTDGFSVIRGTVVYAQSERLELAEVPVEVDVRGGEIELDAVYDGLDSGRWLIISGERTDTPQTSGVPAGELLMVAGTEVAYDPELPGDAPHTTLLLAEPMAYSYKRDTVVIYGNVVEASHGEARSEVLGSGDGSKALQTFTLRQSPLTYLSAPTMSGVESTLKVRVNEILWHETPALAGLGPTDRRYITRTDDEGKASVVFGSGRYGARLSTGVENVTAEYRTGIGKAGNVGSKQISLLATRPLGLKGVINPLPATGGADPETRDQARRTVPLPLRALDRLVSTRDYEDFARTFGGIGKASAARLSDGRRQLVHLTIAGAGDIPIDQSSDLYRNLGVALHAHGDPQQPIEVDVRELVLLVLSAQVRLMPDYRFESVGPQIRAALLDTFSFDRRELARDVTSSEVIGAIHAVPGVAYVDLDVLDGVPEVISAEELAKLASTLALKRRIVLHPARIETTIVGREIRPAQLGILSPELPDTLILTERTT